MSSPSNLNPIKTVKLSKPTVIFINNADVESLGDAFPLRTQGK